MSGPTLTLTLGIEPSAVRKALDRCLGGALSPAVGVLQLLLHTRSVERTQRTIDLLAQRVLLLPEVSERRRRALEMQRLARECRDGCERIVELLCGGLRPDAPAASSDEGLELCRRLAETALERSEEASVALHCLGSAELLRESTEEVVTLLERWDELGPDRKVLQIGCGIGRFEAALAGRVAEAHGIDVSEKMIEAARRRCAGLPNVHLHSCSGRDLADFPDASFDLVYAVDTFPYLHLAGAELVERHFAEVARVLRPAGSLAIFNFSYRDDVHTGRAEVRRLAREHGFAVLVDGSRPFALWDGLAWHLRSMRIGRVPHP